MDKPDTLGAVKETHMPGMEKLQKNREVAKNCSDRLRSLSSTTEHQHPLYVGVLQMKGGGAILQYASHSIRILILKAK